METLQFTKNCDRFSSLNERQIECIIQLKREESGFGLCVCARVSE